MPGQAVLAGDPAGDELGFAAALGDLDGDGFAEAVFGAPSAGDSAGAVAVFRGGPQRRQGTVGVDAADRFLTGTAGERAGSALAAADFDRDRAADLLVGAPTAKAGGPGAGAARVLAGERVKPAAPVAPATAPPTPVPPATAPPPHGGVRPTPRMTVRAARIKRRVFVVGGRLAAGGEACSGAVLVRLLSGHRTTARRSIPVRSDCRFRTRLTVRAPRTRRLTPVAAFGGNAALRAATARGRSVRS